MNKKALDITTEKWSVDGTRNSNIQSLARTFKTSGTAQT